MIPTIGDYHRAVMQRLKEEVDSTPDDQVIGMSPDDWVEYLVKKYGMEPIVLDESREHQLVEVEQERTLRRYDIYTDSEPGTVVRSPAVRVEVPVVPSDTIDRIWHEHLAPNTFHLTIYPEFEYDPRQACFSLVVGPSPNEVRAAVEKIKAGIREYNQSIQNDSPALQEQTLALVRRRRTELEQKHKDLDALAVAVGIPLSKKAEPSTVVPIAPKLRTAIAPLLPPPSRRPERPVLETDKLLAILELLDNGCRQFERTPQAFRQLTEEGLRDILLSHLNAVFQGAAGGETFQGLGKVDIHLRISKGEVFVSELKVWSGPASLREVVDQLRERLTWRDAYGVALILSRNADFSQVLQSVRDTLPSLDGTTTGSVTKEAANHFIARFSIMSDPARPATIHILLYNLFVPPTHDGAASRTARPAISGVRRRRRS
jgi:hypothetical protein